MELPTEKERIRFALYAAILAALHTQHPRRVKVARAIEALLPPYRTLNVIA